MATKAERFKADAQRAAHSRTQSTGKAKPSPGTRAPTASARTRRSGAKVNAASAASTGRPPAPNPASHNLAPRVAKNSPYEFEVSATARPSRKSTRRSPTHLKPDSPLRITAMNKTVSPKERAERRSHGG